MMQNESNRWCSDDDNVVPVCGVFGGSILFLFLPRAAVTVVGV